MDYRNDAVKFSCDLSLGPESTQQDLYESIRASVTEAILASKSITILFYGQTGSGKTYSMFGDKDGLIYSSLDEMFENNKTASVTCQMSAFQIYFSSIFDLFLQTKVKLKIGANNIDLEGLTYQEVRTSEEAKLFIKKVYKNRIIQRTERNDVSSRSHVIIDADYHMKTSTVTKSWKLRFCDLAGSERFPKTKTIDKQLITEMSQINLALSSIGRLMNGVNKGFEFKHLVRSSVLTSILFKDSRFKLIFIGTLSTER